MVMNYVASEADRLPLPDSYRSQPRYLGYRDSDAARPFAKYFQFETEPIQAHVRDALLGGIAPSEYGYDIDDAARMLARPRYHHMETGWTRLDNGVIVVSCRTDMPGVSAAMWDWWFGWFGTDPARYKLWHPGAHLYSAVAEDRSHDRSLTDRQRYIGNVSYIDEYIGGTVHRLAVRFVDPAALGIDDTAAGITHICARVGLSRPPLLVAWLIHQVRPTDDGAEMRSRFFLGHPQALDVAAQSPTKGPPARILTRRLVAAAANAVLPRIVRGIVPARIAHDVLFHCASEMNHLATFLPRLYDEFNGSP
jgi:hypothetical protein